MGGDLLDRAEGRCVLGSVQCERETEKESERERERQRQRERGLVTRR